MGLGMILFLLTFLCLYGGINFYFFVRLKQVLHLSGPIQALVLAVLAVMVVAPILVRILESLHYETAARSAACVGYVWMAFVFLFFTFSLSLELIRVIHKLLVPQTGTLTLKMVTFWLSFAVSATLVIYGYVDAQNVRVKHLELAVDTALPAQGRLRIVQISDVHVGIIIRAGRLDSLLDKIRHARPDILVCTGDLLDGELDNIMDDAKRFAAPYGKFAVPGNHEYYAGLRRALEFTEAAGFRILRDDVAQAAGITFFGEDDITGRKPGKTEKSALFRKSLSQEQSGFTILLKHQPYVDPEARFHLQLSGHTHGGQIFPFGLITKILFPRNYGLHELAPNQWLYISRGAGTWGPPVRVFAPPEITVIDLIQKP